MDDDIDIEEHDVLEDPIIRSIFPDISVIKKEISIYNDDVSASNLDLDVTVLKSRVSSEDEIGSHSPDEEPEMVYDDHDIKTNIDDSCSDCTLFPSISTYESISQCAHSNKIILGSGQNQPSKNPINYHEKYVKVYSSQVYLNDISHYLNKSVKFCKDCNILFSRNGDLNTHKEIYHETTGKKLNSAKHTFELFERLKCGLCFKYFSNKINLQCHLKTDHKKYWLKKKKEFSVKKTFQRNSKTQSSFRLKKVRSDLKHKKQRKVREHVFRNSVNVKESAYLSVNDHIVNDKKYSTPGKKFAISGNKFKITNDLKLLYKCCYCSYYFKTKANYATHLSNKHKEWNFIDTRKIFDPNCTYCFYQASDMYSYNIHLQNRHKKCIDNIVKIEPKICIKKIDPFLTINNSQESIEGTQKESTPNNIRCMKANMVKTRKVIDMNFISKSDEDREASTFTCCLLVLKTVLFKCLKCDIHFVSAKSATNHLDHMEILIHWKCLICKKIFKKNDERVHNEQHLFSEKFTVYELNESQLSRVLYKCSKCHIHFNDEIYASHFESCDTIISDSIYCRDCDILVEKTFMQHHEYDHKTKMLNSSDFICIESEGILSNFNNYDKKNNIKNKKIQKFKKKLNKLCYCEGCKCFINALAFREVHKLGRCTHIPKCVCSVCGLVLTARALKFHRQSYKFGKEHKLQDFIFYDLKNGKRIRPPVPEYPKCMSCKVQFVSKSAILYHVCKNNEYLTCPICEDKLSDAVFKLHVAFHHYSLKDNKRSVFRNDVIGAYKNANMKSINMQTEVTTNQASNPDDYIVTINSNHSLKKCETVIHNVDNKIPHDIYNSVRSEMIVDQKTDKILKRNTDLKLFNVIYCCVSCYITIDTFDKAVEHCQEHYSDVDFEFHSQTCDICKLKYDRRFYGDHNILHKLRLEDKGFTVLKFDAFYFNVDYKYWIQNLFESIEPQIFKSILDNSIYKYEGRIKLRVIKEGSRDYIVYKCNSCRVYIDPYTILSHCENWCFRQRIHPCSYCGLPFISHLCRITHEIDHKKCPDITVKSYKIVTFDREKDQEYIKKIINSRNIFVLYKCRECHGIFDRFQNREHVCNKYALKKCLTCNLLLYSVNYKSHTLKHTAIESFTTQNMRIIFFKQYSDYNASLNGLPSTFDGSFSDYTFHKCTGCGLCYTSLHDINVFKHDCTDKNSKIKCLKCELYIMKSHTNQHIKKHDSDPYFIKENFNFIPYKGQTVNVAAADSTSELESIDQGISTEGTGVLENISEITTVPEEQMNSNNIHVDKISEKKVTLYKCICGLHFLERKDIESHFGHCASRIPKQNCSKCSLLFTPKELFAHLLRHHGDKNNTFKMNVIEMSQDKNKIILLYKCPICDINFIEVEQAKTHYATCQNSESEKNECKVCNLSFDNVLIHIHERTHHADDVAEFEIRDVANQLSTD